MGKNKKAKDKAKMPMTVTHSGYGQVDTKTVADIPATTTPVDAPVVAPQGVQDVTDPIVLDNTGGKRAYQAPPVVIGSNKPVPVSKGSTAVPVPSGLPVDKYLVQWAKSTFNLPDPLVRSGKDVYHCIGTDGRTMQLWSHTYRDFLGYRVFMRRQTTPVMPFKSTDKGTVLVVNGQPTSDIVPVGVNKGNWTLRSHVSKDVLLAVRHAIASLLSHLTGGKVLSNLDNDLADTDK